MKQRLKQTIILLAGLSSLGSSLHGQTVVPNLVANPSLLNTIKPNFSDLYLQGVNSKDNFTFYEPQMRLMSKKALTFRPFSYRDPATGKSIGGSTVLTLPNGKKVTASEYYSELNRHEKFLNENGASLNSSMEDLGTVQEVVDTKPILDSQKTLFLNSTISKVVSPIASDLNIISKQALTQSGIQSSIASKAVSLSGSKALTRLPVGDLIINLPIKPANPLDKCTSSDTLNRSQNWSRQLGNSKFNVRTSAGIDLKAECDQVLANANARLDGAAFSKGFSLARADLNAKAVRNKDYSLNFGVYVVGKQIYKYNKSQRNHITWGGNRSTSINKEMKFKFPIGPVRVAINIGVKGSAQFIYQIKLDGLSAVAEVRPKASSSLYAEGGVDAWIVEGGVGGRFTLLAIELPINGKVEVTPRSGKLYFHAQAYAAVELRALDGKLYAYVKVVVPRWGIPPWKKKKYSKTLAHWNGVEFNRTLFNKNYWVQVI